MRRIAAGVCAAHGATCEVSYANSFVPTINTAEATDLAVQAAGRALGDGNVDRDCKPIGGAEDFARMLAVKDGCFAFLGNGGAPGQGRGCTASITTSTTRRCSTATPTGSASPRP